MSAGLCILTKKSIVVSKDEVNSSKHILMARVEPNLVLLNVYARSDIKKDILNELVNMVEKIQNIEPGIEIIIMGDLNLDSRDDTCFSRRI